jgi:hypothetical protein
MELADAIKLIGKLSRTRNFPQSEDGVKDLAESLDRISGAIGIDPAALVQRCADLSEFCPTDADMWTTAREIKEEIRRKAESASPTQMARWRKEYGDPKPVDLSEIDPEFRERFVKAQANAKRREELWSKLKKKFPSAAMPKGQWPNWDVLAKAARELGYPEYADAWEKSVKW